MDSQKTCIAAAQERHEKDETGNLATRYLQMLKSQGIKFRPASDFALW